MKDMTKEIKMTIAIYYIYIYIYICIYSIYIRIYICIYSIYIYVYIYVYIVLYCTVCILVKDIIFQPFEVSYFE